MAVRPFSCSCAACCCRPGRADDQRPRRAAPLEQRRFRDEVSAVQRAGAGEGRRRHQLLPRQRAGFAQRSRRRSPAVRTSVEEFHAGNRVRLETLAARDDRHRDPRHQARRGRPRPAERAVGNAGGVAPRRVAMERTQRRRTGPRSIANRRPTPTTSTSSTRRWSASWPAEARDAPIPAEAPPALVERLREYMQKAIKEAKTHTSWINQNLAYEDAVSRSSTPR